MKTQLNNFQLWVMGVMTFALFNVMVILFEITVILYTDADRYVFQAFRNIDGDFTRFVAIIVFEAFLAVLSYFAVSLLKEDQ